MPEVQRHGFSWEKDLLHNVYGVTPEEIKTIKYTEKNDIPRHLNRLTNAHLSVKTSGTPNAVCMADCLRVFDSVSSGEPYHLVVVHYKQNDETKTKRLITITEIDLTNSKDLLFGSLSREQIEQLRTAVREVPQKRSPSAEEYKKMYDLRNSLQPLSKAIHLDIKCNSQQSRLQCSFNHFQSFLEEHPERILTKSTSAEFRGKQIQEEIASGRRVFAKKTEAV